MIRHNHIITIALALIVTAVSAHAQFVLNGQGVVFDASSDTYLCSIPESAFGHDYNTVVTLDADSAWTHVTLDGQEVKTGSKLTLKNVKAGQTYTLTAKRPTSTVTAALTFTFLPIVVMQGDVEKSAFTVNTIDILQPDMPAQTLRANVRYRGSSTNYDGIKKRNYSVKFVDENGEKLDISLFGLRTDNNWILDGGALDRLRVRNHLANELWLDMARKPYYADRAPKARNAVRGQAVELVRNGKYVGIYTMSEKMDRKQMRLMKTECVEPDEAHKHSGDVMHGMLWKASRRSNLTLMNTTTPIPNDNSDWGSFEVKYPDTNEGGAKQWEVLKQGVDFVATADNKLFAEQVEQRFDVPVLMDYFIFKEALMLFDNGGKNEYWACYDANTEEGRKLTLAIWDLDTSMGQDWKTTFHASRVGPEHCLLDNFSNNDQVLMRLLQCNPSNFHQRMLQRYYELRHTYLSEQYMIERFGHVMDKLFRSGATQRETAAQRTDQGGTPLDFEDEWRYLQGWIVRHMAYLDSHTFALKTGDVDMDGKVTETDLTALMMVVCGKNYASPAADVNHDGEVNISDLTALASQVSPSSVKR